MTDTTTPQCTCGAQAGKPHDEACPVTAYVREMFRQSGENAQGSAPSAGDMENRYADVRKENTQGPCVNLAHGGFVDSKSPTGRLPFARRHGGNIRTKRKAQRRARTGRK